MEPWLDIKILMKTVRVLVARSRGVLINFPRKRCFLFPPGLLCWFLSEEKP